MFLQKLSVERVQAEGERSAVPLAWLDSYAMRNFTNDARFDDTLPVSDGVLEAGLRVPLDELRGSMEAWMRRKGWFAAGDTLLLTEQARGASECILPSAGAEIKAP